MDYKVLVAWDFVVSTDQYRSLADRIQNRPKAGLDLLLV